MFKLKTGIETFEVVDGPFAGRRFERGKEYAEIPPEEKHKFKEIKPAEKAEPRAKKKAHSS